jgi:hypothetical protein
MRAVTRIATVTIALMAGVLYADEWPSVGMEGQMVAVLANDGLQAKPVDDKSELVVRIASARKEGQHTRYDIRYIGHEPGEYDLAQWLLHQDPAGASDLPSLPVTIASVLPDAHTGHLEEWTRSRMPRLGGYAIAITAACSAWLAVLVALLITGWRGRQPNVAEAETHDDQQELIHILRDCVEDILSGDATVGDKARLEFLLLRHWSDKLGQPNPDMLLIIKRMREHPEAGPLLNALEDWLHRPPGEREVDVPALLAPYKTISTDSSLPEETH